MIPPANEGRSVNSGLLFVKNLLYGKNLRSPYGRSRKRAVQIRHGWRIRLENGASHGGRMDGSQGTRPSRQAALLKKAICTFLTAWARAYPSPAFCLPGRRGENLPHTNCLRSYPGRLDAGFSPHRAYGAPLRPRHARPDGNSAPATGQDTMRPCRKDETSGKACRFAKLAAMVLFVSSKEDACLKQTSVNEKYGPGEEHQKKRLWQKMAAFKRSAEA